MLFDVIERLTGQERESALQAPQRGSVSRPRESRTSLLQVGSMGSQLHDIQAGLRRSSARSPLFRSPLEVNSEIMIAFTSLNLAADFVVVPRLSPAAENPRNTAFCLCRCSAPGAAAPRSSWKKRPRNPRPTLSPTLEFEASNLNLFGALAHLGADVVGGATPAKPLQNRCLASLRSAASPCFWQGSWPRPAGGPRPTRPHVTAPESAPESAPIFALARLA